MSGANDVVVATSSRWASGARWRFSSPTVLAVDDQCVNRWWEEDTLRPGERAANRQIRRQRASRRPRAERDHGVAPTRGVSRQHLPYSGRFRGVCGRGENTRERRCAATLASTGVCALVGWRGRSMDRDRPLWSRAGEPLAATLRFKYQPEPDGRMPQPPAQLDESHASAPPQTPPRVITTDAENSPHRENTSASATLPHRVATTELLEPPHRVITAESPDTPNRETTPASATPPHRVTTVHAPETDESRRPDHDAEHQSRQRSTAAPGVASQSQIAPLVCESLWCHRCATDRRHTIQTDLSVLKRRAIESPTWACTVCHTSRPGPPVEVEGE